MPENVLAGAVGATVLVVGAVVGVVAVAVGATLVVGVMVGVAVVVVDGAANSTSWACREPCSRRPWTKTRSPRWRPWARANADCVVVAWVEADDTDALELLMVMVKVWPPVVTVNVIGLADMLVTALAAAVEPAMVVVAGAMLPVDIAEVAAAAEPVIAVMAVLLVVALTTFAPFSHHRCREPFEDLTRMKFLVASSTMPRCAAMVVWCLPCIWVKFLIEDIEARVLRALLCWPLCSQLDAELSAALGDIECPCWE